MATSEEVRHRKPASPDSQDATDMSSFREPEPVFTRFISMTSPKRLERELIDWIKFLAELIYGLVLTVFYIIKEIIDLTVPPRQKSLQGEHVLVTGAARGLGREICLRLVREGCKISAVDILEDQVRETVALCNAMRPNCATAYLYNITDKKQIEAMVSELEPVDILINNAGIVSGSSILEVTDQQIQTMFDVNVMSHFWTIRAFLPGMIERGKGHIAATASAAAFTQAENIAPYTATKYAVTGMMLCLREEFRRAHPEIKITTLHPFFITPAASSPEHWTVNSRLPDVTAAQSADFMVDGIKKEKVTVTVPRHLYFLLQALSWLPTPAGEIWRDIFYARIDSLEKKNGKTP
ncbi:Dehydrogenase [Nesidiocoris tenuis]|uniref:Dehydrogenase n=2 Tax=Nesidiocoris tenuis TaxID=355587 RepID=A0ABN7B4R0_9HEMI|nr:Dehydrogenase [Nesidiocoris tenuis]